MTIVRLLLEIKKQHSIKTTSKADLFLILKQPYGEYIFCIYIKNYDSFANLPDKLLLNY